MFKPCERDLSWGSGDYEPHFVTCPVELDGKGEVSINADRLNVHSQLRVELLDREFRPIPGYSGDDCIVLDEPGLTAKSVLKRHGNACGKISRIGARGK